jgi:hypothetical protein
MSPQKSPKEGEAAFELFLALEFVDFDTFEGIHAFGVLELGFLVEEGKVGLDLVVKVVHFEHFLFDVVAVFGYEFDELTLLYEAFYGQYAAALGFAELLQG